MTQKIKWLILLLVILIIIIFICREGSEKRPPILLTNGSGLETNEFQLHESILIDVVGLSPRTGYDIQIVREDGAMITELALSTDAQGRIPETVLLYDIGVAPCQPDTNRALAMVHRAIHDVRGFNYVGMNYTVRILQQNQIALEMIFQVSETLLRPVLYAADWRGCPKSGFLIGEEDIWVVGKNFPKGSIVRLWAAPASSNWNDGDRLNDQTKQYDHEPPPIFELRANDTGFIKKLWPGNLTSPGSYDIVADIVTYETGEYHPTATAQVQNIISYNSYSGFVVQRRPGATEPLEVDIAGTISSPYTFRNTFLPTENVYVGVDPCLQPTYVGRTANIFIVPDQTDAEWTVTATSGTDLRLLDITGTVETISVGGICGNCWKTLAWTAPLVPGEYDVVLDFNRDNQYTPGEDLIDALDPVGFIVSDIRVNSISFNYGGSGAITLYDNVNGVNISAPEYLSANHIVKPVAWTMGGSHTVEVEFQAVSTVSSAEIWAEGTLMNLNSSSSPVTVTFAGGTGTATFNVNSLPSVIGKHEYFWNWKFKNLNGTSSATVEIGETGEHLLYTTYDIPNALMSQPWLQVIDKACIWANGESDRTAALTAVTVELNALDDLDGDIDYVPGCQYTSFDEFSTDIVFNLTSFLAEIGSLSNITINCVDCAAAIRVFANAIGLDLEFCILELNSIVSTNYIDPIGNNNPLSPPSATEPEENWLTTMWRYHMVGWHTGDVLYDACLHLDGLGSPGSLPCSRLTPVDMIHATYCGYLTTSTCVIDRTRTLRIY